MTDQEQTERPTPDDGVCPECGATIPADSVLTVTVCPSCEIKIGGARCTPVPPGCGRSYPNSLRNCPYCGVKNT